MVYSSWVVAFAQDRKVTGRVTSTEDGVALPGVSVAVKGTTRGTNTDSNGEYSIQVGNEATLVFSFVGMTPLEISVGNQSVINARLASDTRQLAEIVVTGVGVATDKRKLGISVESISAAKLPAAPSASVDQALVGKIAGAQISSTSGTPGADINILLRGINTINRGTQPMILIDGVQMAATNLNTIDLNTIERVEVVQGAAAATIYGAQGANGVIQLFTKKGKSGQLNIDISSSVAQNTYLNIGDVHKARFHGFATDASNNVVGSSGKPIVFDEATSTYSENVIWNSTDPTVKNDKPYNANLKYYDHYDYFFQPAYTTNNSIAVSGGKDKLDFLVSASNNHQTSNIINNGAFNRTNLTTNIGFEVFKGLTFRTTTQLAYTKNTIRSLDRLIMYSVNNARPFADFSYRDPDGNAPIYFGDAIGVNHFNPDYYSQYWNTNDDKIDVIQSLNLNYKFAKFVELDAKYGINYQRQELIYTFANQSKNRNAVYTNNSLNNIGPSGDLTGEIDNYSYNKTFQNFLATATFQTDWQQDFNSKIPIRTATQVSFDWRKRNDRQYITYATGLPTYTPFNASQASAFKVPSEDQLLNSTINSINIIEGGGDYAFPFVTYGFLVNQRIEFGDIAGISGGFRSDYSSAFGQGSKPFTFPRGDAYFRLSAFKFWENSSISGIFPELKLRAAYGQAGIQPRPFDRYVTLGTKTLGNSNAFYYPSNQKNPDLNVEVSEELEVGADMVFTPLRGTDWLSSLQLSATYWDRKTKNAIYKVDVAPSSGSGTLLDNAFSLGSNGFQASLNATVFRSKGLTWNLTTNFGKQTSKILSVKDNQEIVIISNAGSTNYVLKAGEKIGQLYGNVAIHDVNAKGPDGQPYISPDQQANYEVAGNGWVVNKTTKAPYFTPRLYSFGDPNPKFLMSFINDLSYRNFLTLSFQFDWVNGSHLYNQTKEWMYRDGIHGDYDKAFSINGETAAWTAFYRGVYAERQRNGTKNYFYEDASFVRLRNIAIGFDLGKVIRIPATKRVQLVLSGRNLLTWTKYTGFDPEISSGTNGSAFDRGTDHNTMPNYRSYQATVNIGF
ncbi:SusC/RagA family TonB-linked outer membrane protein [Larkinella soli]|uniref:SusC/RagA family TonB-linked outer membrane protein n=1 Tax=Larkinella soli TaxID=1770527 RepID=UPI00286D7814|nr:SusC/RagA family TonB-linked outer membrane protein [Larkinella soli]